MWYLEFIVTQALLKGSLLPLFKTEMTLYVLLIIVLTTAAAI